MKIWVAALFFAATFIVSAPSYAQERIEIKGMPDWQAAIAERSVKAVLAKIPQNKSAAAKEKIIRVVSDRLFTGYTCRSVSVDGNDNVAISFTHPAERSLWRVEIKGPKLQDPPLSWFNDDAVSVRSAALTLLKDIPIDSLDWCDSALKDEIKKALAAILPGWEPSLLVIAQGEELVMQISFTPVFPLVLAVDPKINSNTLPVLLLGDMKNDILEKSAPYIGLPVAWMKKHTTDVNRNAEAFLDKRTILENTVAKAETSFIPAQVSKLNVNVESSMYMLKAWTAIYAGTNDRSAELGVHIGRRLDIVQDRALEFYGEGILQLQSWDTEYRLGVRTSLIKNLWLGGEWSSKDEQWWGKISTETRPRRPYGWVRVRDDGKLNTGVGWRINSFIALELHYDARDDSMWSLRMIGNL